MSILNDDLERIGESLVMRNFESSPMAKMMRDFESSPMAKMIRNFESSPVAKMIRNFESSPMATMMRDFGSSSMAKMMRNIESSPVSKLLHDLESSHMAKMMRRFESSDRGLSAIFLEINPGIFDTWNSAAAGVARGLADRFPMVDERIVETLREFSAVGDTRADVPDTVVRDGKAGSAQSALLIWLFQQPAYKQAIVISIYVLVILPLVTAIWANRVDAWLGHPMPEARTIIYNDIKQNFGAEEARRLRCVRAANLNVRSEASTAGTIVDALPGGTSVEILETKGSWSRIHYRVDKFAEIREGWAASGYLSVNMC
jgi:hypothetical protein